jgi:hypothetical protein
VDLQYDVQLNLAAVLRVWTDGVGVAFTDILEAAADADSVNDCDSDFGFGFALESFSSRGDVRDA